jgi:hypothetical protein
MTRIDWTGHPPFGRQVSLKHTLELLNGGRGERSDWSPLIVELGTAETYSPDGLGNALMAFTWYAGKYGARIKSVDIREGAVKNAKTILQQYVPEYAGIPEITHADAFDWVTGLHESIDLLYVDAGFELVGEVNYQAFVKRHPEIPSFYVELFNQFDPACFHSGSLMLIDDTSPETYDGKGIFLIPYLLDRGWRKVDMRGVPVFPMVLLEKV